MWAKSFMIVLGHDWAIRKGFAVHVLRSLSSETRRFQDVRLVLGASRLRCYLCVRGLVTVEAPGGKELLCGEKTC